MPRLFFLLAVLCLVMPVLRGAEPEIYSTDFWEIGGKPGSHTWVEIHNSKQARLTGVAHVSVLSRKKGSPVWEVEWVSPHIAITTDALRRSVLHPFETRSVYPERFLEAYDRWKEGEKTGAAVICSTSIQDFLANR